jgi:hypothetical protein
MPVIHYEEWIARAMHVHIRMMIGFVFVHCVLAVLLVIYLEAEGLQRVRAAIMMSQGRRRRRHRRRD